MAMHYVDTKFIEKLEAAYQRDRKRLRRMLAAARDYCMRWECQLEARNEVMAERDELQEKLDYQVNIAAKRGREAYEAAVTERDALAERLEAATVFVTKAMANGKALCPHCEGFINHHEDCELDVVLRGEGE